MTRAPGGAAGEVVLADRVAVEIDGALLLAETTARLAAGRSLALRGANGAGKTTLLRVLAGRLRPSSGAVTLRGRPLDERRREARREVAALIEPPTLYPDLTVRDQLALIEAAWGSGRERRDAAWPGLGTAALERLGVEPLAKRFPHELSSGQRQLVSLAAVLARPCSVLLLDEPEQRLDPDRRALVAEVLVEVRDAGVAVAFASHDPALVGRAADAQLALGGAA